MYQPRSSVCTRISLGLMINAKVLWTSFTSSRWLIFGALAIPLWLTGKSLFAVNWEIMKHTRRPSVSFVSETEMFLWMPSPIFKWWFTHLSAVFGLSSSWPPLVGGGGGLVWESVGMAYISLPAVSWYGIHIFTCCQVILTASSPRSLLISPHLLSVSNSRITFTFNTRLS